MTGDETTRFLQIWITSAAHFGLACQLPTYILVITCRAFQLRIHEQRYVEDRVECPQLKLESSLGADRTSVGTSHSMAQGSMRLRIGTIGSCTCWGALAHHRHGTTCTAWGSPSVSIRYAQCPFPCRNCLRTLLLLSTSKDISCILTQLFFRRTGGGSARFARTEDCV